MSHVVSAVSLLFHHTQNLGLLNISGLPIARTGKPTDICYVLGNNIWFGGLHLSAVKIFQVSATNHIQMEQLDNVCCMFPQIVTVCHVESFLVHR